MVKLLVPLPVPFLFALNIFFSRKIPKIFVILLMEIFIIVPVLEETICFLCFLFVLIFIVIPILKETFSFFLFYCFLVSIL